MYLTLVISVGTAGDIGTAGLFHSPGWFGRGTEGGYLNNLVNIVADGTRGAPQTSFRNITSGKMTDQQVAIAATEVNAYGNHSIARNKFNMAVMESDVNGGYLHDVDVSRQQNILYMIDYNKGAFAYDIAKPNFAFSPSRFTVEIDGFVYELFAKREQDPDYVPIPSWRFPIEEGYIDKDPEKEGSYGELIDKYRDMTNAEIYAQSLQNKEAPNLTAWKDVTFPDRADAIGGRVLPVDWQSHPDYLDGDEYGHGNVVLKLMRDENGNAIAVDWDAANAGPVTQPDFIKFKPHPWRPQESLQVAHKLIGNDEDSDWRILNPHDMTIFPHSKYPQHTYRSVLDVVNMDQPSIGALAPGVSSSTYFAPEGFTGIDNFRYHVADMTGKDAWETAYIFVGIDVDPSLVNFVPEAGDDEFTVVRGEATMLDVLANDTDPEGGELIIEKIGHPERNTDVGMPNVGSAEIVGDQIRYTADPFFTGTDRFVYYALDDAGNRTRRGTVTVHVVEKAPGNSSPVAVDDSAATNEDAAVIIDALANDSDVDGDALSVLSATAGANGSTAINPDGTITYTPDADYNGSDAFSYTISDGNGGQATAAVNVTVAPVNDAPVAIGDSAATDEDNAVIVNVLANDSDVDGDALNIISATNGANGSAVVNPDGTITYTPNADYNGSDAFSYTISDGNGGQASATVSVTVNENGGGDGSTDALVVEYTFDDGTAGDTSPHGDENSGTLVNGAMVSGGTLVLDGIDDFVDVGHTVDVNASWVTQRTISLRFNANDVNSRQVLYEQGDLRYGLNIYLENGLVYVSGWNMWGSDWSGTFLSTPVGAGGWHTVTLVLDGTDTIQDGAFRGYLDGTLFGTGAGSNIRPHYSASVGSINLGRTRFHDGVHYPETQGVAPFVGQIDDLRIYNRPL